MKTTLFALATLLISFHAFADDAVSTETAAVDPWAGCPAAIDGKADLISEQINIQLKKNSIEGAAALASNCAVFGSNIDVSLINPVVYAYLTALNGQLDESEGKMMNKFLENCAKKGEASGGSLGRAMAAHCQLKVVSGFYAAVKKWED